MEPRTDPAAPEGERPRESLFVDLLSQLFRDAETLLLQEFALLRAELAENAGRFAGGVLVILAGMLVVLVGTIGIIAAATLLLGSYMPMWLACALVGAVVIALGVLLGLYGRRLVARAMLRPERTLQSLRETGSWIREELT
jgi:predicted ABC-type sugar transport system permease subunit